MGESMPAKGQIDSELSRAWPVLAAAALGLAVGVHALPFYTAGTFMVPLEEEFGWTRAQLSLGPTLLTLLLALSAPVIGVIMDRYFEAPAILVSLVILGGLIASLATLGGDVRVYWCIFAAMGLFAAGSGTLAFSRVISAAFEQHRGMALGVALTGTGITGMVAPRMIAALIVDYGWRAAYLAMAATVLAATPLIIVPLWRVVRRNAPEARVRQEPQGLGIAFRSAVRTLVFWRLAVVFPLVGLGTVGMIVHFIPLLIAQGFSPTDAASMAGLIGFSMIVARLTSGLLMDVAFAPHVGAAAVALSSIGLLLLALGGPTVAWCGAIGIGIAVGIEFDLIAYLTARYFGLASFGRIYGLLYGLTTLGVSASSLAFGYWANMVATYRPALLSAAMALGAAALLLLTLPRFPSPTASVQDEK